MPRRFEMGDLVDRCKRRADKEFDEHISTSEWKALISEKYGELWDTVSETGCRYFERTSTITATGAESYAEPSDHLATIGLQLVRGDGTRKELYAAPLQARERLAGRTGEAIFFQHIDDLIYLFPKPSSGSYVLLYVPQPTDLSEYANDDVVDVVTSAGEAMLAWGVAAMAKDKGEAGLEFAVRQEERAKERLHWWAINKMLTQPQRRVITDIELEEYLSARPGSWLFR